VRVIPRRWPERRICTSWTSTSHHPTDAGSQRPKTLLHPAPLLRIRVAADLRGQARRLAIAFLAQLDASLAGELDQVLAALLDQSAGLSDAQSPWA
jgi:hypothetical protein